MEPTFIPRELRLVAPTYGSTLVELIIELDHIRRVSLEGDTPMALFLELKHIFHRLESIGSARIEGNNTTVAEYMDSKLASQDGASSPEEKIREIENIEKAMGYVEETIKERQRPINRHFILSLHQMLMDGLTPPPTGEGDHCPGSYRSHQCQIKGASHLPPPPEVIEAYMDELYAFVEGERSRQFDLLKIAIAHHRFVWIHPFGNGNGRVVRLFTYALLLRYGFDVSWGGRIINPTAIFCNDRERYYNQLALADEGADEGMLAWCEYVLGGLKEEIEKIDRLCDYAYLQERVLEPALSFAREHDHITPEEYKILSAVVERRAIIQNADLEYLFKGKSKSTISSKIKGLETKGMLQKIEGTYRYRLSFLNNKLLRGIIDALGREGFLPKDL